MVGLDAYNESDSMLITKKSHPGLVDYNHGTGITLVNESGMKRLKALRLRQLIKEAGEFADSLIDNYDESTGLLYEF